MSEQTFSLHYEDVKAINKAVKQLDESNEAIFEMIGIMAVMRDAICRPQDDDEDIQISNDTRRGFVAIFKHLNEHFGSIALGDSDARYGLENLLLNMEQASPATEKGVRHE